MLADILKQNKVDNSGMRFDPNARTALAFVTLRDDGEREFMFFRNPSADMLLRDTELDANLIKKVRITVPPKVLKDIKYSMFFITITEALLSLFLTNTDTTYILHLD